MVRLNSPSIREVVHVHLRDLGAEHAELLSLNESSLSDAEGEIAVVFKAGHRWFALWDKSQGCIRFYDHQACRLRTVEAMSFRRAPSQVLPKGGG